MYLKENYLQHQQCQEKQNTEQKIRDIAQRYCHTSDRDALPVLGRKDLGSELLLPSLLCIQATGDARDNLSFGGVGTHTAWAAEHLQQP